MEHLREARWLDAEVLERIWRDHPQWRKADGACPACVQQALLTVLLERGEPGLHEAIQQVWPIDAESVYGPIPTPLRMHGDPRYTGKGITLALVDAGFFAHADLVEPRDRIRVWVDATVDPPQMHSSANPGRADWHGLMTSTVAAGNGYSSHGLYRSLASDAELVLVQVRDEAGGITDESVARGLEWLARNASRWNVTVASISVASDGDPSGRVNRAVEDLAKGGVVVLAAAGNNGERRLAPPADCAAAFTIGGLDDANTFEHEQARLWHSNYGNGKPELVTPSMWVVGPLMPDTAEAAIASELFERRARGEEVEAELAERRLVHPRYQFVEGTSFAAPIAASVVACMREANPQLGVAEIGRLLKEACTPIAGADAARQGAGALDAGRAVSLALGEERAAGGFRFRGFGLERVNLRGSFHGWQGPGIALEQTRPGWWQTAFELQAGDRYKLFLEPGGWMADPANPRREPDGFGGFNSIA